VSELLGQSATFQPILETVRRAAGFGASRVLILDEISELPLPLQPKLLRVLEETTVTPVGALQGRAVEAAIVAASNADFPERIAQGRFRRDLYFRLARFMVEVPPLRERRDDIELLTQHFLRLFAREMNLPEPRMSETVLRALTEYDFPGNVRELKNILERALMECEGGELREEHLHFFGSPRRLAPTACDRVGPPAALRADPATEEVRILEHVRTHGSITNTEARRVLECDRNYASYLLHRLMTEGALICEGHGRWARYRLRGCT
jgi:DNA-binding NtrC family response regulator